jgi:hypothetical protein
VPKGLVLEFKGDPRFPCRASVCITTRCCLPRVSIPAAAACRRSWKRIREARCRGPAAALDESLLTRCRAAGLIAMGLQTALIAFQRR